jgi:hypothetical protein
MRRGLAVIVAAALLFAGEPRRASAQDTTDGCNPKDYLFNGGAPFGMFELITAGKPVNYCVNPGEGGGNCWNGWTTPDAGTTCLHTSGTRCPCHYNHCGNGQCACVSSFDESRFLCYRTTTPCPICDTVNGKTHFRQGCGCVDCRNSSSLSFYIKNIYTLYNLDKNCFSYDNEYVCGPGVCVECPKGAYCNNKRDAVACAPGFYQSQTGKAACRECIIDTANTYLLPSHNPLDPLVCNITVGWNPTLLRACDECTEFSQADIARMFSTANGAPTRICPPYRRDFGIYRYRTNAVNGHCLPCERCTGRLYARPDRSDKYCVTDQSAAQCVEMYNANPNTNNYYCTQTAPGGTRDCFTGGEMATVGKMPWLAGYRRTATEYRYIPGEPGAGGILPHYKLCDEANPLASYSGAYAPRSANDQVRLLNEREWSLDCDLSSTRECAPGHYAVLAGWDAPGGLKTLLECLACGSGGAAPGGLAETCTCPPGTANLALLAEDPEIGDGLTLMEARARGSFKGQITQQCVDCLNNVAWLHATERRIRQEALACPGSAAAGSQHLMDFHRCGGAREYVSGETFGCASCAGGVANALEAVLDGEELCPPADVGGNVRRIAPRDIPLENRTGCFFCPPGTHIAVVQV